MKIGMIVYSRTGHTLSVAMKLKEKLSIAGHMVTLEQLETAGPVSLSATSAELETMPAIDAYEALVFGCPVQGGVPAPPMMSFLEQVASLKGKGSLGFRGVTVQFAAFCRHILGKITAEWPDMASNRCSPRKSQRPRVRRLLV